MPLVTIPNQLRLSGGLIDLARCQVQRDDVVLPLTQREVALLRYFAANPGRAITRKELLGEVWGYVEGVRTRATDNAIVRLRNKVEASPDEPSNIVSVRGIGYRFEPPEPTVPLLSTVFLEPEPTAFFGRRDVIDQIGQMLGSANLVTVVGAPGMGKTRVARQYALGWTGPTWFADLSGAKSLAGIVHSVTASLNLILDPGQDAVVQIGRSLRGQPGALLVLDNFEQVVALARETLAQWVRAAPDCRFLTTSRERLLLAGEHCLELGPLPTDSARNLFLDRARSVSPGFDEDDSASLVELVERLDGVPLALELAASRVHMLTMESLATRLRDLGGGRRDVAPRHRTLRDAFQWSWDLLSEGERQAMTQCALFESAFTLEAAEQVLVVSDPVIDVIEGLRNKSMLERVDDLSTPRFRMLTTVREFVTGGTEILQEARERHLDWCVSRAELLVRGLKSRDAIVSARSLAAELPDQLTALQRATDPARAARLLVALDGSPALKGLPDLHMERIDELVSRKLDPLLRSRLLLTRVRLLVARRRFAEAGESLAEAARLSAADANLGAVLELQRGGLLEAKGELEAAIAAYSTAAESFRSRDERADLARALTELARARFSPGDVGAAEPMCLEALDVIRGVGDKELEGRVLGYLGVIAQGRRSFSEAETYFRQSLEKAISLGDPVATVVQTINTAGLLTYLEPSPEVVTNMEGDLRDALDIASHLGRLNLQGAATGVLLQLLIDSGRVDDAGEVIDRMPADWQEIPPMLQAMCWSNIAAARHLRGEVALADRAYREATAAFVSTGHPKYVWRTQTFHAVFLAELDRWDEAEQLFEAAESGAVPASIGPWIRDSRDAAERLYRARKTQNPAPLYAEANALIARVKDAPALKALDSPIRSSHQWVVKCLKRGVPAAYLSGGGEVP
jgi:predicted ATPase/DNA-binding winged helix-turn-helix (wHTH) protein/tetratricopeptide (TPR) repeat protein